MAGAAYDLSSGKGAGKPPLLFNRILLMTDYIYREKKNRLGELPSLFKIFSSTFFDEEPKQKEMTTKNGCHLYII
ncbi:hypothetical protein CWR48_19330 [Oceanobacillus arenosus]|uniref:Uncharacterized protein n=1 Tax=Oceanobacillus arenosus TaxID=1229153 RepID=A0A3D8PJ18_9BACI|nr:hypothetical protein [Oceanobacillus arenosus]RDW15185.1 hypothetical protein CWR48_19330 [Oceanobacillus arenosus]